MMKCLTLCLVLICAIAVNSYPQQRVTLVGVPQSQFFSDAFNPFHSPNAREVDETGEPTDDVINFETPGSHSYGLSDGDSADYYPTSFADLMRSMQEAVVRLRQEMNGVLDRLPEQSDDKGLDEVFSFGSDLDLSNVQNKSTSETKVVDGQLVTVNETVIRSGDDHGGSVFRVKTIQVRPTDSTPSDSTPNSDATPVPEILPEVETQSSKNDDSNDIPHVDEPQMRYTEWDSPENENDAPSNHLNDIETFYDIEMMEPTNMNPVNYDLSKDTRVNDYLSEKAKSQGLVLINPDAEFIDVDQVNPKENEYYRYESHPVPVNEDKL